jgi:hypothetical protein
MNQDKSTNAEQPESSKRENSVDCLEIEHIPKKFIYGNLPDHFIDLVSSLVLADEEELAATFGRAYVFNRKLALFSLQKAKSYVFDTGFGVSEIRASEYGILDLNARTRLFLLLGLGKGTPAPLVDRGYLTEIDPYFQERRYDAISHALFRTKRCHMLFSMRLHFLVMQLLLSFPKVSSGRLTQFRGRISKDLEGLRHLIQHPDAILYEDISFPMLFVLRWELAVLTGISKLLSWQDYDPSSELWRFLKVLNIPPWVLDMSWSTTSAQGIANNAIVADCFSKIMYHVPLCHVHGQGSFELELAKFLDTVDPMVNFHWLNDNERNYHMLYKGAILVRGRGPSPNIWCCGPYLFPSKIFQDRDWFCHDNFLNESDRMFKDYDELVGCCNC